MAEGSNTGGGNAGMAFIVGALVVIVAVLAFLMVSGGGFTQKKKVDVDITASAPQLPDAPKAPAAPSPPKPGG
jgi:ABC-type transporter Mla subunit MlaD